MPRQKAKDPKVSLSLRLRASTVEALKARAGETGDWRGEVEKAVEAWLSGVIPKPKPTTEPLDVQLSRIEEPVAPPPKLRDVQVAQPPRKKRFKGVDAHTGKEIWE